MVAPIIDVELLITETVISYDEILYLQEIILVQEDQMLDPILLGEVTL